MKATRTRESLIIQKQTALRRQRTRNAIIKRMFRTVENYNDFLETVNVFGPMSRDEKLLAGQVYTEAQERRRLIAERIKELKTGIDVLNSNLNKYK